MMCLMIIKHEGPGLIRHLPYIQGPSAREGMAGASSSHNTSSLPTPSTPQSPLHPRACAQKPGSFLLVWWVPAAKSVVIVGLVASPALA